MNIKTAFVLLLLLPFSLMAAQHSTGGINLMQTNGVGKTKNIFFALNNNVKGVLKLYWSRAYNKDTIKGVFIMNNTGNQKYKMKYRVVFKDRVGAVAQSKGDIFLSPGKYQKKKFGSVVLAREDMRNIDSYDIKIIPY